MTFFRYVIEEAARWKDKYRGTGCSRCSRAKSPATPRVKVRGLAGRETSSDHMSHISNGEHEMSLKYMYCSL
jgi:hypothetical protein